MNSNLKAFAAFIFGGALGAAAGWYVAKKQYESHVQEEIDSVKEAYGRKKVDCSDNTHIKDAAYISPEPESNTVKLSNSDDPIRREVDTHKTNYVEYQKTVDTTNYGRKINFDPDSDVVAYVIPETEFGELEEEGYHTMSLVYYLDDILADYQDDEIIDNVEQTVGSAWKKAFDKGEDIVYVRNDRRMCDYEILRSEKSYKDDVLPTKPPTLEERHDL